MKIVRSMISMFRSLAPRTTDESLHSALGVLRDELGRKFASASARLDRLEAAHTEAMDLGIVASYGGSGTTMLVNFMQLHSPLLVNPPIQLLGDGGLARYRLKHLPAPPCTANLVHYPASHRKELEQSQIDFSRIRRALYVYADPVDVVISMFRREQQFPGFLDFHLDNIGSNARFGSAATLVEYLKREEDVFGFERHFIAWAGGCELYPIMLVKYSAIWAHLNTICDFMWVPGKSRPLFPPQRRRTPTALLCSDTQRVQLEKRFRSLRERQLGYPDVIIVGQSEGE